MDDYCGPGKYNLPFKEGDPVEFRFKDKQWYSATVTVANRDTGKFDIKFADGRTEVDVESTKLREPKGFKVGSIVDARWNGYPEWYAANVTKVNEDGTYDVVYLDDGVIETSVDTKYLRIVSDDVGPGVNKSADVVCKVKDEVEELKKQIGKANKDVDDFVKRAKGDTAAISEDVKKAGPPQNAGVEETAELGKANIAAAEAAVKAAQDAATTTAAPTTAAPADAGDDADDGAAGAPAPAAAAPTGKPKIYSQRTAGTCADFNGRHVTSIEGCAAAATAEGLPNPTPKPDEQGGVNTAPPFCYVAEGGVVTFEAGGKNTGICTPKTQCICEDDPNLGYSHPDPAGNCAGIGGKNANLKWAEMLDKDACLKACTEREECTAFEWGPGLPCKMFAGPVESADGDLSSECWIKDTSANAAAGPAPAPAADAGAAAAAGATGAGAAGGAAAAPGGAGAAPAVTTIPPAVKGNLEDMITKLRGQILGRSQELMKRGKALGGFDWQMEKYQDLIDADGARIGRPMPTTMEGMLEEIKRLEAVNVARAKALEEQLQKEKNVVAGDTSDMKPSKRDAEKVAANMETQADEMEQTLEKVKKKRDELEANGELDPELKKELDATIENSESAVTNMKKSSEGIRLGQTPEEFVASLEMMSGELRLTGMNLGGFGSQVIPKGLKWWRYRWEYSFTEALIICLLCLIAAFWQKMHDSCRGILSRQVHDAPNFTEEYLPHVTLVIWVRVFRAELVVLLFVIMTLWLLARIGFFELWMQFQYHIVRGINLPEESVMYVDLSFNVAMQLVAAVILFFILMLQICYKAMENERDCKQLEEGTRSELVRDPVSPMMIGKFATSDREFAALKKGWLDGVARRSSSELTPRAARGEAQEVCDALDERGVLRNGNRNVFPLASFINQRVRIGVEQSMTINAMTWLCCWLTFFCFALLHAYAQVAYIRISMVLAAISISVFVYMIFVVKNLRDVHDDGWMVRISPRTVVFVFQLPLFFLCFVTTRLVVSIWMWMYFFHLALLFTLMLIAFLCIFPVLIAPLVITYLIKTSFPPHTNGTAQLIKDVMEEREIAKVREEMRRGAPRAYRDKPPLRDPTSSALV